MLLTKQILKNSFQGLKLTGVIGLSAILITTSFMHNALYAATSTVATNNVSELTNVLARQIPVNYVKPNYTLQISEYSEPTTANELTTIDAAEIISQEAYRYLNVSLEGKTLELCHSLNDRGISKPTWHANIIIDRFCTLHVKIDSVTGEVHLVTRDQLIPMEKVDPSLENAYHEDIEKKYTERFNANRSKIAILISNSGFIPEKVKSLAYHNLRAGTYYDGPVGKEQPKGVLLSNEIDVTTESGKIYRMTFSEDFTRIDGIDMPDFVASSDTLIAKQIASRTRN